MNNNYEITLSSEINNLNEYFIVFILKGKQYAINIQNVMEVINIPEIEIPSKAPQSIIGMFNYNGLMIKAVDLCPYLGFEPSHFSISNQLIITIVNGNCFAIHTEKIENITTLNAQDIQPIPYNMKDSILKEVCKTENESINIIDMNTVSELVNKTNNNDNNINYTALLPSDEKSKQILKIRAQQNKSTQEVFSFPFNLNTMNQHILFTLDNHNYFLDLKFVKEFISIKRLNITKLPYTKDYIKGIINLKGDFLVVLDLKRFLNNDINTIHEGSKLIIAKGKDFNIAILVDEIKYIKNLKNIDNHRTFSGNSKYISSEFMEDDQLYSILNFEKIINDDRLYINVN